jgi:uncharacterized membrane protein
MGLGRVEAFSDGVIAVILTIMVLELKAPENGDLSALLKLKLPLLNYLLSFVVIGIFWVNHRSILSLVRHVEPAVLWWNNALLFWMSLVPFATAYMGQSNASPLSVAVYGGLLAITSSTFGLLRFAIAKQHKADPKISRRHKQLHVKDAFGVLLYALSVALAFVSVRASFFIFILIPVLYFLPEKFTELTEARTE